MELYGDNSAYGTVRVDVNDRRCVLPVELDDEAFPVGCGGLIPIATISRRDEERTVYAFPSDAEVTAAGATEEPLAPGDPRSSIVNAIEIANDVMKQASDLIREDLGQLVCAFIGISELGFGFTRAEVMESEDTHHMRLIVETSDEPGTPGTATCLLDYDELGRPSHISIVARDTETIGTRIHAAWRHDLHAFKVLKVEELDGSLLYKAPVPRKKRGGRK